MIMASVAMGRGRDRWGAALCALNTHPVMSYPTMGQGTVIVGTAMPSVDVYAAHWDSALGTLYGDLDGMSDAEMDVVFNGRLSSYRNGTVNEGV